MLPRCGREAEVISPTGLSGHSGLRNCGLTAGGKGRETAGERGRGEEAAGQRKRGGRERVGQEERGQRHRGARREGAGGQRNKERGCSGTEGQ